MTITPETISDRSRRQHDMTALLGKLKAAGLRQDDVETLGCTTEPTALVQAALHLTHATAGEIIAAMQEIERVKLKTYASVKVAGIDPPPYAGIPDSLKGISKADLRSFVDRCRKTTFASGNKYQPLPTHDEAWQAYVGVFQGSHITRQHASHLKSGANPSFSDEEVINAATWGFWRDMTLALRRRAYRLLPQQVRNAITRQYKGDPEGAMEAVREYYDELSVK
ncbi:MAG: hypothetical protein HGB04_01655 [Chlorobiaceae bacterium]|nr:hypothetical protein [Chlorobiaceae bacterium]